MPNFIKTNKIIFLKNHFNSFLHSISYNLSLNRIHYRYRVKFPSVSLEEFTVKLDPLKTKSMEETLHSIHKHNHTYSYIEKEIHSKHYNDNI